MTSQRTASMTVPTSATTGRAVIRRAWDKLGATIQEMNYAAGRVALPRVSGESARTGV
jgi:hypothetical protein